MNRDTQRPMSLLSSNKFLLELHTLVAKGFLETVSLKGWYLPIIMLILLHSPHLHADFLAHGYTEMSNTCKLFVVKFRIIAKPIWLAGPSRVEIKYETRFSSHKFSS